MRRRTNFSIQVFKAGLRAGEEEELRWRVACVARHRRELSRKRRG